MASVKENKEVKGLQDDGHSSDEEADVYGFKDCLDRAFEKRKKKCYDLEAYILSSKILNTNSDFHVMWNFRREIILHWKDNGNVLGRSKEMADGGKNSDTKESSNHQLDDYDLHSIIKRVEEALTIDDDFDFDKICLAELEFTKKCLAKHLKSYATWHHRRLIIKCMKKTPIEGELDMCSEFFDLDPRNFHCWNYREFICQLGNLGIGEQTKFSSTQLEKSLYNFSAFHYRGSSLLQAHKAGIINLDEIWDQEYYNIASFIKASPYIQSTWLYIWWLLRVNQELLNPQETKPTPPSSSSSFPSPSSIYRVIWDEESNHLVYQFHSCLHRQPFQKLIITQSNGTQHELSDIQWHSTGVLSSDIWYHKVAFSSVSRVKFDFDKGTYDLELIVPSPLTRLSVNKVCELPRRKNILDLPAKRDITNLFSLINDSWKLDDLESIESDNKYVNLTLALLPGTSYERYFDGLQKNDYLRRNHYRDRKSQRIIETKLSLLKDSPEMDLTGLSLTCLHSYNRLTHLRSLNLSNNHLARINSTFNSLVSLQVLILDNNQISSIDPNFCMPSLKRLSLKHNNLQSDSSLKPCNNCPLLEELNISGNRIVAVLNRDGDALGLSPKLTVKFSDGRCLKPLPDPNAVDSFRLIKDTL